MMKVAWIVRWRSNCQPVLHEFSTSLFGKAFELCLDLIGEPTNDIRFCECGEHSIANRSRLTLRGELSRRFDGAQWIQPIFDINKLERSKLLLNALPGSGDDILPPAQSNSSFFYLPLFEHSSQPDSKGVLVYPAHFDSWIILLRHHHHAVMRDNQLWRLTRPQYQCRRRIE